MASVEAPLSKHQHQDDNDADEDLDADAILAELEADDATDLAILRNQRLQEQSQNQKSTTSSSGLTSTSSGAKQATAYQTLRSDDDTLHFTTEHEKAVVHFFHPDFARCSVMDDHLAQIARKHQDFSTGSSEVKFARVDVGHAAFVVQKLNIRVLPCVIGFEKGAIKGRVVGFEGLCWDGNEKDSRVLRAVEERMAEWGILKRGLVGKDDEDVSEESDDDGRNGKDGRRGIKGRKQKIEDEDDDWD